MKKTIFLLSSIAVLVTLINCTSPTAKKEETKKGLAETNQSPDGFALLENTCFFCHSPGASKPNPAAPAFAAIKETYLAAYPEETAFTRALSRYLANPSDSLSILRGAVKKYGLMPKLGHTAEQVAAISKYIYHTPLEKKSWYETDYPREKEKWLAARSGLPPLEKGSGIASRTKAVLGMYLLTAISQHGAAGAVDFCSTRALHITDSMGKELGAGIRRVAERNRNPVNQADSAELSYSRQVQNAIRKGESFKPAISETAFGYRAYYPILTDKLCLQCHGDQRTEINPATFSRIRAFYPADKATGFRLNELRGIWVIDIKK